MLNLFLCGPMRMLVIFFALYISWAQAQMLDNSGLRDFEGEPVFVRSFIRDHSVQSMLGLFSTKADFDEIRPSNDACYYRFNRFGELVYEYRTSYLDTIHTVYSYDERSNVSVKRIVDKFGFQSLHYTYDQKNRVVRVDMRVESNTGQDIFLYVPDASKIISSQVFEYVDLSDSCYKKNYLNESGLVYREDFFYLNSDGKVRRQESYQKSGSGNFIVELSYDSQGRLIEKKATTTIVSSYATRYSYHYDAAGNIESMRFYENEVYKTEYQYIYDGQTALFKALIQRDVSSNLMTIVKYDIYSFF